MVARRNALVAGNCRERAANNLSTGPNGRVYHSDKEVL